MNVLEWERARAQAVADAMRENVTSGVGGADAIPPLVDSLPPGGDESMRLAVYGMLAGLEVVEPPQLIRDVGTFFNNWSDLGTDYVGVWRDPFGLVHWEGLASRLSGVATNGELICSFPLKYAPTKPVGYPCITNSGLIHIGIFPDGTMTWRTTGGFTGSYSFVYLDNIGVYRGAR